MNVTLDLEPLNTYYRKCLTSVLSHACKLELTSSPSDLIFLYWRSTILRIDPTAK